MNISSLQPLNTKHMRLTYAAIIISVLLLASLGGVGLSAADHKENPSKKHDGLRRANVGVFVATATTVLLHDQVVGPHTINTETTVGEYSGDVAGTLACTRTVILNFGELRFTGTAICNFVGSVLGSDPGSMTKIFSFDGPFGGPVPGTVQFSQGVGGLQGICGGGTFLNVAGEVFYDYVFAFGDDCDDLDMSDFLDALEDD